MFDDNTLSSVLAEIRMVDAEMANVEARSMRKSDLRDIIIAWHGYNRQIVACQGRMIAMQYSQVTVAEEKKSIALYSVRRDELASRIRIMTAAIVEDEGAERLALRVSLAETPIEPVLSVALMLLENGE